MTLPGWFIDDLKINEGGDIATISQQQYVTNPGDYELLNNYPNPFNAQTIISYQIPKAGHVRISVYNLMGQEITMLCDEMHQAGIHKVLWDGKDQKGINVPSGIYLYRFEADDFRASKKMLMLK
jgi:flagellar hook assembly protein FlgD